MIVARDYDEQGFVHSLPILTAGEVRHYRARIEETCNAAGGGVARLDAPHLFFAWAWELGTHPRLLDCVEELIGAEIVLQSTRLFYKHAGSRSYVGWHQDGITERLEDASVPAVWLGLTDATVANGCLRVIAGSHRLGLVAHRELPDDDNLTSKGITAQARFDDPCDVVMRAGEMSLHHPLLLHASGPNRTGEPRIGFSATYCPPRLAREGGLRVRGVASGRPPYLDAPFAVHAYVAGGFVRRRLSA